MYPFISSFSLALRFILCYLTIEQLPIFANVTINWIFGQVLSIYIIFRIMCYPIVGHIVHKYEIKNSSFRSFLYLLLYLPLVGLYWMVLLVLTHVFRIFPLS